MKEQKGNHSLCQGHADSHAEYVLPSVATGASNTNVSDSNLRQTAAVTDGIRSFTRLPCNDPALAKRFALSVFDQYWGEGRDIRAVADLAGLAAGLRIDPADLKAARTDDDAKQRTIQATEAAIESGCYGVPWFTLDGETFWGHDRIPYIDRWLGQAG